jgi:hypothetical protein
MLGIKLRAIFGLFLGIPIFFTSSACAQEDAQTMLGQLKEAAASQIGSIDIRGRVISEDGQPLDSVSIDYYFREFGDIVADKEIVNESQEINGSFRIKRSDISTVNIWAYKLGYYSKRWSFGFNADTPRQNPGGFERVDLEIVLEKQPDPAPLNRMRGILRTDMNGPVSVVFTKQRLLPRMGRMEEEKVMSDFSWPNIYLESDSDPGEELQTTKYLERSQSTPRDGLAHGRIRMSHPDPGDGFVVYDPGEVPARPEIAMRGMNIAPGSGYGTDIEVSASESPSKVYFFCKIHGQYGKGMVSGRPVIAEEDGRQVARALILIYLNPTGSRDVAYIHN